MAKIAGHSVQAAQELPVGHDSGADALGNRHHYQVAPLFHAIEPGRREDAGIGGVLELHFKTRSFHDGIANVEVGPLEVGGEDEPVRALIETAGQADSNAFDLLAAAGSHDAMDA